MIIGATTLDRKCVHLHPTALRRRLAGQVANLLLLTLLLALTACDGDGTPVLASSPTTEVNAVLATEASGTATSQPVVVTSVPTSTPAGAYTTDGRFIPFPTVETRWFEEDGRIRLPVWDDRNPSAEQKAADPRHDPRWPDFVRCMERAGFGAELPPPDAFRQANLDRLVATINEDGPFLVAQPSGLQYVGTPASDALLACADAILAQRS
jgi:hypothetical protein